MYYFIVNPGSRTGKSLHLWETLEKILKESGSDYKAFFTTKNDTAEKITRRICIKNPEMKRIIIVGGDGTVNQAINGLTDYNSFILGYIPTGSSNDLARGLGISLNPSETVKNVLKPKKTVRIDHGLVVSEDGKIIRKFAVSSGIGYDADICEKAENSHLKKILNKIRLGKLVYYLFGFLLIFLSRPTGATVIIDGKRKYKYRNFLFAANMNIRYEGGGMPMGPDADPFDGKITACIVHDMPKLKHLWLMTKIIKGKHVNYKGVEQITAKTIEIKTDRPLTLHTDGEIVGKNDHVTFSCFKDKAIMIV